MLDLVTLDLVLLDPEDDADLRPDGCVRPRVGQPHVPGELLEEDADGHQAWEQLCHSSEEDNG